MPAANPALSSRPMNSRYPATPYPTDFFGRGAVYHIACNGRYGPALFTCGVIEPDFAVPLGNNPKGFFQLAARAEVVLDTPERRDRYVATFLDTTKDLLKRTQF